MNNLKGWIIGGMAAAALLGVGPARAAADRVEGDWLTPGGNARVRVAACTSRPALMCGALVWLKSQNDKSGAPLRDSANPDIRLQGRPLIGLALISGFTNAGTGSWVDGKIYDPGQGKDLRFRMRLNPDGSLKVEGRILIVCSGQTWTRPT